jgi:aspartyl-tRNA(Asn)/glutamyl-tRNA(Gln) amidotransferase subunit B
VFEYESKRQVRKIEDGFQIKQETRLFDSINGETRAMRNKEESHDYRYFPDPDLPPLVISQDLVNSLRNELPELPDEKKNRFIKDYGIKKYDAEILTSEKDTSIFFETLVKNREPKLVISWLTGELFSYLKRKSITLSESKISPEKIGSLIDLIENGTISNRLAKELFEEYLISNKSALQIVNEKGMSQVSDEEKLKTMIDKVLNENPKMLKDYLSGKERLFGFFVGQVMKISNGKANPQMVNTLLKEKLK